MKIIVKSEELLELKHKLLEYISNINSEFDKIENIKNSLLWEGFAHTIFINKYDLILKEEKKRIAKLEKLLLFIDDVLLNYGMALDEIKNTYRGVNENLEEEEDYE